MNQTPLNPDALEAGHEAYRRAYYRAGDSMAQCFEKGLSAYLAVAQPVVNSVEELDALPDDTLLQASGTIRGGRFIQSMIRKLPGYVTGTDKPTFELPGYLSSEVVHGVDLPARVLHRPEVNDA